MPASAAILRVVASAMPSRASTRTAAARIAARRSVASARFMPPMPRLPDYVRAGRRSPALIQAIERRVPDAGAIVKRSWLPRKLRVFQLWGIGCKLTSMKTDELGPDLLAVFRQLPDTRSRHGRRHPLAAILTLATV